MKFQVVCFVVVLGVALAADTYSPENDNFNIDGLIKNDNPAQLQAFVDCFLDKSPCDATAGSFRKDIGEAIQQNCAKCTPPQKIILKKFLVGVKEKLPQEYEALKQKFDPEGKQFVALESALV